MADERMTIGDEVAAFKRQRTLTAATELFYEKGYTNTTLDDVAERLGVTKPFIYKNFGSKHMLLAEICASGVQAALNEIDAALALGKAPGETLSIFVPRYVEAILTTRKAIAINIREEKNLLPEDAATLSGLRQKFVARVEDLLSRGKDTGEIKVNDPRISAFAVVGAVSWLTFWYSPDGPLPPADVTARLSAVVLNLLSTDAVANIEVGA
ncbi:TetR/AcrR family transcriptional regulator [Phaeobacter sp. 22II1-1F12B]|uniref:TetR/AcrR family transcriptional regulator n=1 Tax=Phaeobacter sp. 22II1-1F12B TaxID=1317111 RepID=UPI000B520EB0|nr:TetR/AcrR family transcriptional regulator [Phaeobacter sp. 22II1-1F12B]